MVKMPRPSAIIHHIRPASRPINPISLDRLCDLFSSADPTMRDVFSDSLLFP